MAQPHAVRNYSPTGNIYLKVRNDVRNSVIEKCGCGCGLDVWGYCVRPGAGDTWYEQKEVELHSPSVKYQCDTFCYFCDFLSVLSPEHVYGFF